MNYFLEVSMYSSPYSPTTIFYPRGSQVLLCYLQIITQRLTLIINAQQIAQVLYLNQLIFLSMFCHMGQGLLPHFLHFLLIQ